MHIIKILKKSFICMLVIALTVTSMPLTQLSSFAADSDKNSELTASDARKILRISAGLE